MFAQCVIFIIDGKHRVMAGFTSYGRDGKVEMSKKLETL